MLEVTVKDLSPVFRSENLQRAKRKQCTVTVDLHAVTEVSSLSIDLDSVVKEFLKGSAIENTVTGGSGVIDHEFMFCGGNFGGLGLNRNPVSLLRR